MGVIVTSSWNVRNSTAVGIRPYLSFPILPLLKDRRKQKKKPTDHTMELTWSSVQNKPTPNSSPTVQFAVINCLKKNNTHTTERVIRFRHPWFAFDLFSSSVGPAQRLLPLRSTQTTKATHKTKTPNMDRSKDDHLVSLPSTKRERQMEFPPKLVTRPAVVVVCRSAFWLMKDGTPCASWSWWGWTFGDVCLYFPFFIAPFMLSFFRVGCLTSSHVFAMLGHISMMQSIAFGASLLRPQCDTWRQALERAQKRLQKKNPVPRFLKIGQTDCIARQRLSCVCAPLYDKDYQHGQLKNCYLDVCYLEHEHIGMFMIFSHAHLYRNVHRVAVGRVGWQRSIQWSILQSDASAEWIAAWGKDLATWENRPWWNEE